MSRPSDGVRHDEGAARYVLAVDGADVALAEYRLDGDTVVFHHTYTQPAERGRGHAARLVAAALDDVRARRRRVVATCWYVDRFLDDHPGYADLRRVGP